jgi:hypothetical protein
MVGQNQNWERSDQPRIQFKRLGLKRLRLQVLRQLRFWLVAALPVLILRGHVESLSGQYRFDLGVKTPG